MMDSIKFLILCFLIKCVVSDTPANCTYEDVVGTWNFYAGNISLQTGCLNSKMNLYKVMKLSYPNTATDQYGNIGKWTLIYNQGFEVVITNKKYFGFFDYKKINSSYAISYCHKLQPMFFHDTLIRQWGCIKAEKLGSNTKVHALNKNKELVKSTRYGSQKELVDHINNQKLGWTAKDYPEFHMKSIRDILKMAGGKQVNIQRPKPAPITNEQIHSAGFLPKSFDWRNTNGGVNYVSPVRHQDNCGSCYSFASAGMLEARFRIRSNNTVTPVLSPQDVVECSPYSQGCSGGFPYLIAGKYAEDFGMAAEFCNPYKGQDGKCSTTKNCKRYYATKYGYIGGFYGGCNELRMKEELIKNGPFAVGFEVYNDFMQYHGGIYHHDFNSRLLSASKFGFDPFELTNHAVLVVGYGETGSGEKYWSVKNSWGTGWGESGYFRIRRGNDECGIESLGVTSDAVF